MRTDLQDINMEIKYRPGNKNSNTDAPSRYPVDLPTMKVAFAELSGMVAYHEWF